MSNYIRTIRLHVYTGIVISVCSACFSAHGMRAVTTRDPNGLKFISDKPKYAKVALDQAGTKILGIAFDEGQGTSSRYDTAYVFNADIKGPIKKYIKIKSSSNTRKGITTCAFNPTVLPVKFNGYSKKVDEPWELTFQTVREKSEYKFEENGSKKKVVELNDEYTIQAVLSLKDKCEWKYGFTREFKTADTLAEAPVMKFNDELKVNVTTQRLKDKVGMNVELTCGECEFVCENDYGDAKIDIEIVDANGKIVKQDNRPLDNLKYRLAQRTTNCAPSG
jgi:hypothetical protein